MMVCTKDPKLNSLAGSGKTVSHLLSKIQAYQLEPSLRQSTNDLSARYSYTFFQFGIFGSIGFPCRGLAPGKSCDCNTNAEVLRRYLWCTLLANPNRTKQRTHIDFI